MPTKSKVPFVLYFGSDCADQAATMHTYCPRWNYAVYSSFQADDIPEIVYQYLRLYEFVAIVLRLPTITREEMVKKALQEVPNRGGPRGWLLIQGDMHAAFEQIALIERRLASQP